MVLWEVNYMNKDETRIHQESGWDTLWAWKDLQVASPRLTNMMARVYTEFILLFIQEEGNKAQGMTKRWQQP